ncbi:MAG: zinc ribbon domain-containing protein [Clostridia bacterium]|nr:zinc ribbon domain-containing protein [Clostridia bacterium]
MRKTYAYNGIIIGFLIGLYFGVKTRKLVVGIVVGLLVSVAAFVIIKVIENAVNKGADKLTDKAQEALQKRKEQKAIENGSVQPQAPAQPLTQFPGRSEGEAAPQQRVCPNCGQPADAEDVFCKSCGGKIDG